MFSLPWYCIVFISFPQYILTLMACRQLYKLTISVRDCLVISALVAICTYFIRTYPLPFGIPAIIITILIAVLLCLLSHNKLLNSLVAVLTIVIVWGVLDIISFPIFTIITGYTLHSLGMYPWLNILLVLPEFIVFILFYLVTVNKKIILLNLGERNQRLSKKIAG